MIMQRLVAVLFALLVLSPSSTTSNGVQVAEHYQERKNSLGFDKLRGFVKDWSNMKKKAKQNTVNVDDFGAKGDGIEDDSKAFLDAWEEACNEPKSVLLVPRNKTYLLKPPIKFIGPCKPNLVMRIHGTIKASPNMEDYENDPRKWVVFEQAMDFTVDGGGAFNGNGKVWWDSSCKVNKTQAVTFEECTNLRVKNLRFLNAQQMHLTFQQCKNVDASDLIVTAPEKSPNTDGIHVTASQNLKIRNSMIGTGDDCISIVSGSKNVRATNIMCGPGHGISIGSLGKNHSSANVSGVYVNGAAFSGTTNGVRIKTWQGGLGYAQNIEFKNIVMMNVTNPIIIDQNYCDQKGACPEQKDAVQVRNVVYKNIKGTSASEVAMKFDCSKTVNCESIKVENIHLFSQGDGEAEAFCANAKLSVVSDVYPSPRCKQGQNSH